jgi:hypothetical protein
MSLGKLADTGASEVLRTAIEVMDSRGWIKGLTKNFDTGEVDVLGAIAIAAGAKIKDVDDRPDLLQTSVPEARRPAAYVAWESLEYVVNCDPLEWQDRNDVSYQQVKQACLRAAETLERAYRE